MLTKKEIQKIAELVKIKLSENEENTLFRDINDILDYIKKIQKYEVPKKIKANNYKEINLRKDEIKIFQSDLLISQFSDKRDNLLRVKKVL